mgnify:CR=1 FL=1
MNIDRLGMLFICTAVALAQCATSPISAAALESGKTFYVAPSGDDAHSGTETAPFATVSRARDAIRALKAKSGIPEGGITVWLEDGEYPFSQSLQLSTEDSGSAGKPIVYRAVNPGAVRILGGRQLPSAMFKPLAADATDRIQPEVRDTIRAIDLKALGIVDYGQFPDAFRTPVAIPELFFDDEGMTLAQWPNEGWAEIEKVIESGPAPWRKYTSAASDTLGVFQYTGDRPKQWRTSKDVWLEGYWCFDWASETIRLDSIDPAKRHITLAKQHGYGIGSGNPAPRRFRALNLLEELDAAGEYYLDRQSGILYFLPPKPLENARIVLSLLNDPLIQANDVAHVAFQGITFETTSGIGLTITDCQNVTLAGCTVRNTGLEGVVVAGGNGCVVDSSDLYAVGTNGLIIGGGDRKTLTPSNHQVINNHIHHVSRRMRTQGHNIKLNGVGVLMSHNLIEDAPHQAIGIAGNDHIIEFNEINRVGMDSDDCGALYMGRNPSERGTIIRYNYWHHIGGEFAHGSCSIYFDDGTGGQTVHGNVFYKASGGNFGAVFTHGGHDNVVTNNIFIDCSRAIGAAPWNAKYWKEWLDGDLWRQRLHEQVSITSPLYTDRYPGLKNFMESDKTLRLNYAKRNLAVNCKSFANGNWSVDNCVIVKHDPGFIDMKAQNFNLRDDAQVLTQLPGFEKIPFDEMGLYVNAHRITIP